MKVLKGLLSFLSVVMFVSPASFGISAQQTSDFEKWKQQNQQQFQQYVSEQDKAFSSFLKQKWVKAEVTVESNKPEQPKVPVAPVKKPTAPVKKPAAPVNTKVTPVKKTNEPIKNPAVPESKPIKSTQTPEPIPPKVESKEEPKTKQKPVFAIKPIAGQRLGISFLGHQLTFPKSKIQTSLISRPSGQVISDVWLEMSKSNFADTVAAFKQYQQQLNLDDWGLALLVHEYVKQQKIYDSDTDSNHSVMQNWFYLVKLGLNARIAYDNSQLFLLLNTSHALYAQKYFSFGSKKFYFVDFSNQPLPKLTKVSTYQKQHQSASSAVNIELAKVPYLVDNNQDEIKRNLSFSYNGETFEFDVNYQSEYIDFLSHYPQVDVKHYFESQLSENTKQSLLKPLAEIINGRSEIESLNILLRFVQKALAYQTDDQQFNKEKFMFATEALHFPYADCEDRSVLFAYLVDQLMGNKIIGVLYKGHIATAVKVESDFNGANYLVNGEKYFVADPTYIGADLGEVMPGYEQQAPKMIRVN